MARVRKAVLPVAGLGTRFLPATKAIPKEMLTIVDRPLIQHAVEECRAAGIELVDFKLTSRALPSREEILALDAVFARMPRPFLMHCKSGADRAGFAAALYLLLQSGASVEEAKAQLSWRYLHVRGAATGVLHFMIERYAAESAVEPMSFREWVERRYDPEELMAEYRGGGAADLLVDKVLRRE